MIRIAYRARGIAAPAVMAAVGILLSGCNVKQELLAPQQPGVISPASTANVFAADAEYLGAIKQLNSAMNGGGGNLEGLWQEQALFTDEVKSTDTFSQRNDDDQRNLQTFDADLTGIYNKVQQVRGFARTAINGLSTYDKSTTGVEHEAEMYMVMGYVEMQLSGVFCNGIPFGETVNSVPQYAAPISDADGSKLSIARQDTALALLAALPASAQTGTAYTQVLYATKLARARAQVDLGDFTGAIAQTAAIPTSFQYTLDYSATAADNEWWTMGLSLKRYSVGDSIDLTGQVFNAIPFGHLNDPRVPVTDTHTLSEDSQSDFVSINIWQKDDPVAMLSGIDARLIEAEAKLQTGDYAGMMTILNALRTAKQTLGIFVVQPLPALTAAPTDKPTAMGIFFREKALWQFGRGYRMDDLRRQVRQYGLTQDKVFPSGNFIRGGQYGTEVAFPVVDAEKTNPMFTGCTDTKA